MVCEIQPAAEIVAEICRKRRPSWRVSALPEAEVAVTHDEEPFSGSRDRSARQLDNVPSSTALDRLLPTPQRRSPGSSFACRR